MPNADRLSLHALALPRPRLRAAREATLTPIVAGIGVLAALLAALGGKIVHRGWTARKSRKSNDDPVKDDQVSKEKGGENADA